MKWNYENFDYAYYDSLTSNEMKDFLRKYYPIGLLVEFVIKETAEKRGWSADKIVGQEFGCLLLSDDTYYHPSYIKPSVKHIRNEKLKQLGI